MPLWQATRFTTNDTRASQFISGLSVPPALVEVMSYRKSPEYMLMRYCLNTIAKHIRYMYTHTHTHVCFIYHRKFALGQRQITSRCMTASYPSLKTEIDTAMCTPVSFVALFTTLFTETLTLLDAVYEKKTYLVFLLYMNTIDLALLLTYILQMITVGSSWKEMDLII